MLPVEEGTYATYRISICCLHFMMPGKVFLADLTDLADP